MIRIDDPFDSSEFDRPGVPWYDRRETRKEVREGYAVQLEEARPAQRIVLGD
jgi:hypothetical protein